MADELFPGYDAAISSLPSQQPGAAPPLPGGGGLDMGLLQQMLLQMAQPQQEQPTKQMPTWLAFIPGGARGYAMRQQMDTQAEELKLQKQRLAGQQAQMRLQQLAMMQKIEEQQRLKRWGSLYGGLVAHEDVLDPQATAELEGTIVRELAQSGNPEAVQKFLDARQTAKNLKALRALEGEAPATPPAAPESSAAPEGVAPPPAIDPGDAGEVRWAPQGTPPAPQQAVYEQMARSYAQQVGVNPDLAVAVMRTESSGNPQAVGDGGKAVGLYQLHKRAAQEVGLSPGQRWEPQANIRGGIDYLKKQLDETGGNVPAALQRYNGGGTPDYVQRVLAEAPGGRLQAPQDQVRLATLRQQAAVLQRNIAATTRMGNDKNAKAVRETWQKTLDNVREDIQRLEKRQYDVGGEELNAIARAAFGTNYGQLSQPQQQYALNLQHQWHLAQQAAQGREAASIAGQKAYDIKTMEQQAERERQAQGLFPQEKRKLFTDLRQDIRQEPTFKTFQEVRNGYQNVRVGAGRNDAQGDLAIVNGYAKILDPNSTVRQEEFRTVEEAQGFLQRWFNTPAKFISGNRLMPEVRQRFLQAAGQLAQEKLTAAQQELRQVYEPLAREGGLNFEQLLPLPTLEPVPGTPPAGMSPLEEQLRKDYGIPPPTASPAPRTIPPPPTPPAQRGVGRSW